MVPPLEESEDGDRVSFPRWGKRNGVSFHFTELVLEITEMDMFVSGHVLCRLRTLSLFNFFLFAILPQIKKWYANCI